MYDKKDVVTKMGQNRHAMTLGMAPIDLRTWVGIHLMRYDHIWSLNSLQVGREPVTRLEWALNRS